MAPAEIPTLRGRCHYFSAVAPSGVVRGLDLELRPRDSHSLTDVRFARGTDIADRHNGEVITGKGIDHGSILREDAEPARVSSEDGWLRQPGRAAERHFGQGDSC